jgi:hypothetical protein
MGKETRQAIRKKLEKVGGKLSSSEFDKIKEKLDVSGKLIRQQAKKEGIRLPGSGPREEKTTSGSDVAKADRQFYKTTGMYPSQFDAQAAENLINAQGNIDTQIANLNGDVAKYVSQLQTGAQKNIANTQAGATRYVADRELESNLGVENIRAKGAIDLQGIVNAGMERVEGIRGEYGIKGKKVDRSTAILGGLVSAFNF